MSRLPSILLLIVAGSALAGNPPGWWTASPTAILQTGGTQNNYAVANNGQLKFMAWQAKVYLDATLPGGAGPAINALVAGFEPKANPAVPYTAQQLADIKRINFSPVVFKHLKSVANVFYTRLKAAGYNTRDSLKNFGYPADWSADYPFGATSPAAADYSPVTVGQLKMVFSFNVAGLASGDKDGDGLGDAWEMLYFGTTIQGISDDADADGTLNGAEQQAGTNPGSSGDADFDGVSDVRELTVDGTDPFSESSRVLRRIAHFPFEASNFASAEGQTPRLMTGVTSVAGWKGNAVRIGTAGNILTYDWKRSDGSPNYAFKKGSVRLWIKPDWSSAQMSGAWSRLYQLGAPWGYGKAYYMVRLNAGAPTMAIGDSDGQSHYFDFEPVTPFQWSAGTWHQVVITWSSASHAIYVDGVLKGESTSAWPYLPKLADIIAGGLTLGNESTGGQPIYGALDEVEFFNYELTASEIQANMKSDPTDADLDGVSDAQEAIDGTNPLVSSSVMPRRIAYFPLDNANFANEQGQLPRTAAGVTSVAGLRGNAARIDGNGKLLTYDWKRPDGSPNYSFTRGTVRLWIKPDWGSTTMSQAYSRLYQIGDVYGSGKAYSMLHFHATVPHLFGSEADGFGNYFGFETTANFQWSANTWHQIVYTYSPIGRKVYVDGVLVGQSSGAWPYLPNISDIASGGLTLGNEATGGQPIKGAIDEVEFFNYELSDIIVSEDYNYVIAGGVDTDGLPDEWEEFYFGPNGAQPGDSADGDSLTNRQEYLAGTDPTKADTDGDGIDDGAETTTSAARADSDQDLMPDKWEQVNGPSPTVDNRSEDPEPDGMGRTLEHLSGRSSTTFDSKADASDRALDIFSAY